MVPNHDEIRNRREMILTELHYKYHKIMSQSFQNPSFQKDRLFLLLQTDVWGWPSKSLGKSSLMAERGKKQATRFFMEIFATVLQSLTGH
jgi:hypothetical protein